MTITLTLPARHRVAVYDYVKGRRLFHQEQAYKLLGEQCSACGSSDGLRLRFLDPNNPLRAKYAHSPSTLYRRLCNEPSLRQEVRLLCRLCRLDGKPSTSADQATKPLEHSHPYEGENNA